MRPAHMPGLDSVRAFACLLVLAAHASTYCMGDPSEAASYWLFLRHLDGVALFFVLSGFLISGILIDTHGEPGYLRTFFARRALRIFPLYLFALFMVFVALRPVLSDVPGYAESSANQWWLWAHLSNWYFILLDRAGFDWLCHFWSLGVEEQFYIVWPFVALVTARSRAFPIVCIALIIACPIGRWILEGAGVLRWQRLTPFQVDLLAAGGLLAWAVRFRADLVARTMAMVGRCGLLYVVGSLLFAERFDPLYRTAYGAVCAWLVWRGSTVALRLPWLEWVGRRSYGIYVYHLPIMIVASSYWMGQERYQFVANHWLFMLTTGALSCLVAELSWRWLEAPCLALRDRIGKRRAPAAEPATSPVLAGHA